MALIDTNWYINFGDGSTTGYFALTKRPQNTAVAAGVLRRQFTAPASGSERVFVCIIAGTTANVTDATWVLTRGAKTTDGTATWQECTGVAAVNGDAANTPAWASFTSAAVTLGQIIKRSNGASYWICSTAGTAGSSEPAWANDTAGTTRTDNTATWTCLGVVGNFTGWQAPHARLLNAFASTWGQAGNNFYMASASAESYSSGTTTFTCPGTFNQPANVVCVGTSHAPPTSADVTTGASIQSLSSAFVNFINTGGNTAIFDGVNFTLSGNSLALASGPGTIVKIKNSTITLTSSALRVGNSANTNGSTVIWENVNLVCNSGSSIGITFSYGRFEWHGGTLSGTHPPATLLTQNSSANMADLLVQGCDLSAITSGTLVTTANSANFYAAFVDCKIGSSVVVGQAGIPGDSGVVDIVNCDSGTENYRNERWTYAGSRVMETTIIRTGGASDGTTSFSRKLVTTANVSWPLPFNDNPIAIWNDVVGSPITVTLFGIWGGGAVPNNDDFWIDVDYLGSSASPVSSRATSGKANSIASGSALSSDTSGWGGSTTPFKTSVTITPQMKGYLYVNPKLAKASTTLYCDEKLLVA